MSKKQTPLLIIIVLLFTLLSCRFSGGLFSASQPSNTEERLFEGIEYIRRVTNDPRPMVIHIVKINLLSGGLIHKVSEPTDPNAALPIKAKTTSEFLEENNLFIAINADGFSPWLSLGPLSYPFSGSSVRPNGFAASKGVQYGPATGKYPTLFISENNRANMEDPVGDLYNAVSGLDWIIYHGQVKDDLDDSLNPRTTVGIDQYGHNMVIVVVDGRQSGYSEGASLKEIAAILLEFNVFNAMNMDGGGSSTLVIADENGQAKILNSPIHQGSPGTERPVGNHFGVITKP